MSEPHRWFNGKRTRLECGRSWVEPRSGQNKDYKISICCFFAKHVALRRKSKDWLARNQGNVSEWGDMLTRGLNPTKRIGLVQSGPHHHLIENEFVLAMI